MQHSTRANPDDIKKKSNLHYTGGITSKRVTSDGIHLCGLASVQHSSKGTSQRWRVVTKTASDFLSDMDNWTYRIIEVYFTDNKTNFKSVLFLKIGHAPCKPVRLMY